MHYATVNIQREAAAIVVGFFSSLRQNAFVRHNKLTPSTTNLSSFPRSVYLRRRIALIRRSVFDQINQILQRRRSRLILQAH